MTSKAFARISAGLTEALAIAQGTAEPARLYVASDDGWAAIERMLEDEDDQQPSAETVTWLRKAAG